jgi:hypothetical protein
MCGIGRFTSCDSTAPKSAGQIRARAMQADVLRKKPGGFGLRALQFLWALRGSSGHFQVEQNGYNEGKQRECFDENET